MTKRVWLTNPFKQPRTAQWPVLRIQTSLDDVSERMCSFCNIQLEQCRASLSANEGNRDQLRRDVLDLERRLNQTQDTAENYRREGAELRRSLGDITKERDTLSQSNTQLRETLHGAETRRIR